MLHHTIQGPSGLQNFDHSVTEQGMPPKKGSKDGKATPDAKGQEKKEKKSKDDEAAPKSPMPRVGERGPCWKPTPETMKQAQEKLAPLWKSAGSHPYAESVKNGKMECVKLKTASEMLYKIRSEIHYNLGITEPDAKELMDGICTINKFELSKSEKAVWVDCASGRLRTMCHHANLLLRQPRKPKWVVEGLRRGLLSPSYLDFINAMLRLSRIEGPKNGN